MPTHATLLYDGKCRFCVAGSRRLMHLAKPGTLECVDFNQPGVVERYSQLTRAMCEAAMQLVTPDGRVYSGFAALVEVLATRRLFCWVKWVYSVPPVRWVMNRMYRLVARNRHRIMGRVASRDCESGTCPVE